MRFDGKRIVVTGAASGIGKETVRLLSARGANVLATDIVEIGLGGTTEGVDEVLCDVTSSKDRQRLVQSAGVCHGLVNAAGILKLRPISDVTESDWDATLAVNLKGVFFLARDIGAAMPWGGSIVNLSSVAAKNNATQEALCYGASKAGVLAVTRGLAHHFGGRGIRVNAVLPGITDTPMQREFLETVTQWRNTTADVINRSRLSLIPLEHRAGGPGEIAESIAFLLSDAASYVTGEALAVDGGFLMQ